MYETNNDKKIGKYGGKVFLISLTFTILYLVFSIYCAYWSISLILTPLNGLINYGANSIGLLLEYFRNGGTIRGYTCTGESLEEDIICQIKSGLYKFYRVLFLNHILKYVVTFFDTTNFFNLCTSLWVFVSVFKGIFGRALFYTCEKIKDLSGTAYNFARWYSELVFVNIEHIVNNNY